MPKNAQQQQNPTENYAARSISWWSWRPGVKPRTVMLIGSLITCVALLFTLTGLIALVFGILDSVSAPLPVSGTVRGHAINGLDGQAHLVVSLSTVDFPPQVTAVVDRAVLETVHDGDNVVLDYSPHLHVLLALEQGNQRFLLQNGGMFSIFLGTCTLLVLGLVLLPYPALLTLWAWRDLYGRRIGDRQSQLTGQVIARREAKQARANRPGLAPRTTHSWYGVALASSEALEAQSMTTFAINREMYDALREGDTIRVTYSPHLHYVYTVGPADA